MQRVLNQAFNELSIFGLKRIENFILDTIEERQNRARKFASIPVDPELERLLTEEEEIERREFERTHPRISWQVPLPPEEAWKKVFS